MPSDPEDRATHRTRQCDTGQGCDTEEGPWAFQTRKHFGYGTSRKEPGLGPGCNLEIELNHGWGIETRSCSLAAVGTGLSAYLGCALVVRGVEKQERPGGRLKAEIRLLVSLPTAKPLDGSLTSCQEPHTARGEEGGT